MKENADSYELWNRFCVPPSDARTAPFWIWNSSMEESEITESLDELKSHGFGGVFIHPRPGLYVPYLSPEWYQKCDFALREARKRGLKVYLYDENSYPSGFGGGHVSAELPDCLATSVRFELKTGQELTADDSGLTKWFAEDSTVKVFSCYETGETLTLARDITECPRTLWTTYGDLFCVLSFVEAKPEKWLGGFANVDLLRPEAAQTFLQKIYQPYFEHFGEYFGSDIPAIFSDEPSITGSNLYGTGAGQSLPFSYWFAYEFQRENGYDLTACLPALFCDVEAPWFPHDCKKIRYDYYLTSQKLWTDHFLIPVSTWCHNHGIAWTGHFIEDDWPRAGSQVVDPSTMANYEFMDWPAVDLLMNFRFLTDPTDTLSLILWEVKSAANQFGKEKVLCESFGAGGWDSTLEDFKRIGDWLLVNGINFLTPHYTAVSLLGCRKRDHPLSFDWREPWWDDFTELNDYFGRLSSLFQQGVNRCRILVIHPTMTGYLRLQDREPVNLQYGILPSSPDMRGYLDFLQKLRFEQWDFDLGDEILLRRHGSCQDGKLCVGQRAYDLVILPAEAETLCSSTCSLLSDYLAQGGVLLTTGTPGMRVDGALCPDAWEFLKASSGCQTMASYDELLSLLPSYLPPRITADIPWAAGVEHMEKELNPTQTLYFIVNHSLDVFRTKLTVAGSHVEIWDPWTLRKTVPACVRDGSHITFTLRLNNQESLLFMVSKDPACQSIKTSLDYPVRHQGNVQDNDFHPLCPSRIVPETDNYFLLDYTTMRLDGHNHPDLSCAAATKILYRKRGYSKNPWDNEIQFNSRTNSRNHYDAQSGFCLEYRFDVRSIPLRAELLAEQGEAYELQVNGHSVRWEASPDHEASPGLDHDLAAAMIRDHLVLGSNFICLQNDQFHNRLEIESLFLKGSFGVYPGETHWHMDHQPDLTLGALSTQGYPFYPGTVRYEFEYRWDAVHRVLIRLPHCECSAMRLFVNNIPYELAYVNGQNQFDITSALHPGSNLLCVRLCASLKNLLGPHFAPDIPRRTAWPNMWRHTPAHTPPLR